MANSYVAPVSASQVGLYFVQQYYHVLQQQPDCTFQFYNDSSSIVRVDGVTTQSASSMQKINELIVPLNFTAIEIKTINSLESWDGGFLVVVSGFVKSKNFSGWRKFLQTFFLAPQEKGFFVLNDIFHFVDEEAINEAPAPTVSEAIHEPLPHLAENETDPEPTSSTVTHPEEPQEVSSYPLEMEATEFVDSIPVEEVDEVQDYTLQDHQQEHSTVPEPVEEPSSFQQIAKDTVQEILPTHEEPVGEAPKLTYASILRAPKGSSMPTVTVHPPFSRSTPQPFVQQSNAAAPAVNETSEDLPDGGSSQEEGVLDRSSTGGTKSIYVKNLPSSISTLEVLEEFKNFGRVKQDGVFLRCRQDGGACYAFVEFEDAQSAQNAVKASPIKMAGRPIFIEMRKPSINSTTRGGRRGGRGRGGRIGGRISEFDNGRVKSNGFRSSN